MGLQQNEYLVDGKVEELVKVACNNEQGFYITYRSHMKEGESIYGEPAPSVADSVPGTTEPATAPWLATAKGKKQAAA